MQKCRCHIFQFSHNQEFRTSIFPYSGFPHSCRRQDDAPLPHQFMEMVFQSCILLDMAFGNFCKSAAARNIPGKHLRPRRTTRRNGHAVHRKHHRHTRTHSPAVLHGSGLHHLFARRNHCMDAQSVQPGRHDKQQDKAQPGLC